MHVELERTVALKLISPERATDPAWRARFWRESRLAAGLDHPAILTVFDSGEHDGLLYVTMRLVDGPDLGRRVRTYGPLDATVAVDLVAQVASALDAAHSRGLVHRDVKPANILLEPPRAFLGDFGLAKPLHDTGGPTTTGDWLGTVDYAAPEQISDGHADARSDVYALTGVLYTALTGRAPFPRQDLAAIMWAHVHAPPPRMDSPEQRALGDVVARGMAKDPDARFATAGELARAARAAIHEPSPAALSTVTTPSPAPPPAPSAPAGPSRRRLPWLVAAAAAVAAVVVAAAFALTGGGGRALDAQVTVEGIRLPGRPIDVAFADGRAWVAIAGASNRPGTLVAVEGHKPSEPLQLPGQPLALAAGDHALWVLLDNGLQRIDAEKRRPVGGPIDVDTSSDSRVAVGEGAVWVSDPFDDTVIRIDPDTSRVRPFRVLRGVGGPLTAGEGAIWVLASNNDTDSNFVTPVNPRSGESRDSIRVGRQGFLGAILAVPSGVWVGDVNANALRRIDPGDRRLTSTVLSLNQGTAALAEGDGVLWATDGSGQIVARVDPSKRDFGGPPVPVAAGNLGRVAVGGGAAWVTNADRWTLLRLGY